jgi:putative transposase
MGSVHDFKMFKMIQEWIDGTIELILDEGFQGVGDYHYNYLMPKKASKKNPLSDDEKLVNSLISSIRMPIEHVFAKLKRFKIISTRFRNNLNQFQTKFNLIVGLYNFSLRTQGKGL